MAQSNRYFRFSKLGEAKFRHLVRCFALDLTATHRGLRFSVRVEYVVLAGAIADVCEQVFTVFAGEFLINEELNHNAIVVVIFHNLESLNTSSPKSRSSAGMRTVLFANNSGVECKVPSYNVRENGYPEVDFEPPAKSRFDQVHVVSAANEPVSENYGMLSEMATFRPCGLLSVVIG